MSTLIDRFPFLSIVPADVRTAHLLASGAVRVRVGLKRVDQSQMRIGILPEGDHTFIADSWCAAGRAPFMQIGAIYEVEVDEHGGVMMRVDGSAVSSTPPIEHLLQLVHTRLREKARGYADDLKVLSAWDPAILRSCARGNLDQYFDRCRQAGLLAQADWICPRVRTFCLGCLQHELGKTMPVLICKDPASQVVGKMCLGSDPRIFEAISKLIGENVKRSMLLIPFSDRCGSLTFPIAYARLYEAGFQTVVDQDFRSALAEYISTRASTPAES